MLDTHEVEDFKPGEVYVYPLHSELEMIEEKDERRFAVIETEGFVHVYPLAYFESLIAGENVEPLPDDVLRVIISEWLDGLPGPGVTVAGPAAGYDEDNE